ncbi:unnamed protein product [Linum trigynum]|uniref:Uncharacterized protein n=1 Tax=Linum trigynum TaxID=586398 RepID=A0AAV2F5R1_9ROSI
MNAVGSDCLIPGEGEAKGLVSGERRKETRSQPSIFEAEGRNRLNNWRSNCGGVLLEDHRDEMGGIDNELPVSPVAGDSGAEGGTRQGNYSGLAGEMETDSSCIGNQAPKGPQLHFALDSGEMAYRARPVLIVKDIGEPDGGQAAGSGGEGQGRMQRRTVILAGMCHSRVPVVCLYDSLRLPFD